VPGVLPLLYTSARVIKCAFYLISKDPGKLLVCNKTECASLDQFNARKQSGSTSATNHLEVASSVIAVESYYFT
jgi:hypothetical protein